MFCGRKLIGLLCLSVGVGMLLSILIPWFNFLTSLLLIAFGAYELFC